jgi:hypothetical protein
LIFGFEKLFFEVKNPGLKPEVLFLVTFLDFEDEVIMLRDLDLIVFFFELHPTNIAMVYQREKVRK